MLKTQNNNKKPDEVNFKSNGYALKLNFKFYSKYNNVLKKKKKKKENGIAVDDNKKK
jgi:hypothetical protein